MRKIKIWDNINQEWYFDDITTEDDSLVDIDRYCRCSVCQHQKGLEYKKEKELEKLYSLPDKLFEL